MRLGCPTMNHNRFPRLKNFPTGHLGLKPVKFCDFEAYEVRFGIKQPLVQSDKGVLRVTPKALEQCIVVFRKNNLEAAAIFQANVMLPSIRNLPKKRRKMLIRSPFFDLLVHASGMTFKSDPEVFNGNRFKIEDWINYLRLSITLCSESGSLTITSASIPRFSAPITQRMIHHDPRHNEFLLRACEEAQKLLRVAGAIEPKLVLADMASVANEILWLGELRSDGASASPLRFTTESGESTKVDDKMEFLLINYIPIGEGGFAYFAVAEMLPCERQGGIDWQSSSIQLREISFLQKLDDEYESFIERAKASSSLKNIVLRTPDEQKIEAAPGNNLPSTSAHP